MSRLDMDDVRAIQVADGRLYWSGLKRGPRGGMIEWRCEREEGQEAPPPNAVWIYYQYVSARRRPQVRRVTVKVYSDEDAKLIRETAAALATVRKGKSRP